MSRQTTAELLVRCLENENVEYIFGLPGEENMDLLEALTHSSIQFITTRHEQGAAFMADIYGRLTGKAGVCLSTLGPGATNLMTGVADANLDGAPVVAITGQVGTNQMHIESHQYLDLVNMFSPVTKWSTQIVRPDNTAETVRKAFKIAETEKPGAVHIDLPENIAAMPVTGKPLKIRAQEKTYASSRCLNRAATIISRAKNPIVITGNGTIRNSASEALTNFATAMNIPVANTFMGKGAIPFNHPLALWTIGVHQSDLIGRALENADLVIAVGYDLIEYSPKKWNPYGKHRLIHIGCCPAQVDSSYIPEVEVVGDISDSLTEITKRVDRKSKPMPEIAKLREKIRRDYEQYATDNSFPLKPQRLIYDLRQVTDPEDIVISDVGAHKMWMARHYHCESPNTCIISNGFASMGIAVPGAIAASLVFPEKKVLAVAGDGGFLMNFQEFETALRVGNPFVTVVFNDNGYGLIKYKQLNKFGKAAFVDLENPDFVRLAKSMGLAGYRVETAEEFLPILRDAFSQKVPAVVECPVDNRENFRLSQEPALEDGSPPTGEPG